MEAAAHKPEGAAVRDQKPLVLSDHSSQQLRELAARQVSDLLGCERADLLALLAVEIRILQWLRRIVDRLRGNRLAHGVVLVGAHGDAHRGLRGTNCAIDRGAHRVPDELTRPIGARAPNQLVTDVAYVHDLFGDEFGIDLRDLALAFQEQALCAKRADLAWSRRLKDHPDSEPIGDVADDRTAEDEDCPGMSERGRRGERYAGDKAEDRSEADDEAQLLLADFVEDSVGDLGVLLDRPDHHHLDVKELVEVAAELARDRVYDLGELLLDARVDRLAHLGREVVPKLRVLSGNDAVDRPADVALRVLEDVIAHALGIELVVDLTRRPQLRDPLVDRDAPHLGCARGDDSLPAHRTVHEARHLLNHAGR